MKTPLGRHTGILMAAAGLALLAAGRAAGAEGLQDRMPTSAEVSERVPYPLLRVPFMKTPPKVDGHMDPREWEDSACYTGFWQDYAHNCFFYMAILEKQPQFYIGYDKENLYFAHRSPVFPKAAWLKCRGKYKDVAGHPDYGVLWDDHVEFQILPSASIAPHAGFFKWMFNPIHTPNDFYTRDDDYDFVYDSGFALEGQWNDTEWVSETAIPLKALAYGEYAGKGGPDKQRLVLPIPDGTIWRHWGSRAIGGTGGFTRLFSATTPGGWTCNSMRLIFDSRGVSAQVETVGSVMTDAVDLHIQLKNHGERSETVRAGFYIENDTELILANEDEAFVELLPGEVKDIRIKKDKIGITPKGDALWVDIRTLSGMPVQRSVMIPFHHVDGVPDFRAHFIDGMKYSRPPRKPFEYVFAYYPSTNALLATVDTDVLGVADAVKTAVEARVKLVAADGGEEIQTLTFPLETPATNANVKTFGGRTGHGILRFSRLKPGSYKTLCLLYDANKKIVSDQESKPFEQRSFPWENSTEGLDDVVWEPYAPLGWDAGKRTVSTLMHEIGLDASGLPAQIRFKGRNPNFGPQFRAPMRLEAAVGGRRFTYAATGELKPTLQRQSELAFETAGKVGPVVTRSRVQYDCDGFMTCDLYYQTGAAAIDSLECVLDLDDKPVDLWAYQGGREFQRGGAAVLTRQGPVLWNSRDDNQPRELFYGNFVPCALIGNGDRAFVWTCSTDKGMNLTADKPAMQLECTEAGEHTLRVFLVNDPGAIREEKHVQFYLTSVPTKPKPKNHRTVNWKYEAPCGGPMIADGNTSYSIHLNHEEDYAKFMPKPIVPRSYTTANLVCLDMPGLRDLCYAGEWMGQTDVIPNPDARGSGGSHPVTGRAFDTIFLNSTVGWRWVPTMVECALYWRSRQVRFGGQQGWWWDSPFYGELDTDPVVGEAYYLPSPKGHDGGNKQYAFAYRQPRQFLKRLMRVFAVAGRNTGSFTAGIQSTSATYGGVQTALAEFFLRDEINWEGAASYSAGYPHMEYWNLDVMRLCACNYTGLNGYFMHDVSYRDGMHPGDLRVPRAGTDPILDRSLLGNALLHDLGSDLGRHANKYPHRNVLRALEAFGYFEDPETTEFIPYWRSQQYWTFGLGAKETAQDEFADSEEKQIGEALKNVLCTIYLNHKTGKALLVLANYGPTPLGKMLAVKESLLGKMPTKCTDVEHEEPIGIQMDTKDGRIALAGTFNPVFVDRFQFRLLQVE